MNQCTQIDKWVLGVRIQGLVQQSDFISGPTPKGEHHEFDIYKPKVELLVKAQRDYINTLIADARRLLSEKKDKEAGLALFRSRRGLPKNKALIKLLGEQGVSAVMRESENYHLQDQQKEMHKADETLFFSIDEKIIVLN